MQVGIKKNSDSEQERCAFLFEMNDGLPSIVCFKPYLAYMLEREVKMLTVLLQEWLIISVFH